MALANLTTAAFRSEMLQHHNVLRAEHGAAPLLWDAALEAQAQAWADQCVFEHSVTTSPQPPRPKQYKVNTNGRESAAKTSRVVGSHKLPTTSATGGEQRSGGGTRGTTSFCTIRVISRR
jgi:hypothetical protein